MKKLFVILCGMLFVFSIGANPGFAGTIWLDKVISFDQPSGSSILGGGPENALGPADAKSVSIDTPEILIVAFTDNSALDGDGNDIKIYEDINHDSSVDIYASMDNSNYVYLGMATGNVEYDISNFGKLGYINYLMFVGLDDGGSYPGFDLDAVWALHSGPHTAVPIPGALWLLGSGLIGIVGIRKKFKK